jgi:hypothetical protein
VANNAINAVGINIRLAAVIAPCIKKNVPKTINKTRRLVGLNMPQTNFEIIKNRSSIIFRPCHMSLKK